MKRTLILLGLLIPGKATPINTIPKRSSNTSWSLKHLLSDAEYEAHRTVMAFEEALYDIPSIIRAYEESLKARYEIERPDSYSEKAALVSQSLDENNFIAARSTHTKEALTSLFPQMTHLPRVGFCGSGGGVRAMYETLGTLCALEELGLLDTVMYASGLSGSTWALNPWVASKKSIKNYTADLIPRLTISLADHVKQMTQDDLYRLLVVLGRAYYNKQHLSLIDLYGTILSHLFLKDYVDNPYQYPLTLAQKDIQNGSYPHILSTSVLGTQTSITHQFGHKPTYEFSPYLSGSNETKCFVPTWAVARTYSIGTSQELTPRALFPEAHLLLSAAEKIAPSSMTTLENLYNLIITYEHRPYYGHEVPLGYLMGICGSAFSTDIFNALLELYQLLQPGAIDPSVQQPLKVVIEIVQELLEDTIGSLGQQLSKGTLTAQEITTYLKNNQFAAARMPNMRYLLSPDPFDQLPSLTFIDGGFDLMELDRVNLGIVPLLYRDLDLIIINDASADNQGGSALRAAEKVARLLKRPFPTIDYTGIDTAIATLIVDEHDLKAPVLLYMPGIANSDYDSAVDPEAPCYSAQVFQYPLEKAQKLVGLIEYNTLSAQELIFQAYYRAAQRKKEASITTST